MEIAWKPSLQAKALACGLVALGYGYCFLTHALTPLFRLVTDGWPTVGGQNHLRHFSGLFREPDLFRVLPEYLQTRFPQGVAIYSYAAATGAEPYSIVMKLLDTLGDEAARYFPIRARELSEPLVRYVATSDGMYLQQDDLLRYREANMKTAMRHFLCRDRNALNVGRYVLSSSVRNQVDWGVGDLRLDIQTPFTAPCVLLFRNAWYQISTARQAMDLCRNLYRHLPAGSALILGQNELERYGFVHLLLAVGFVRAGTQEPFSRMLEKPF